MEPMRRWGGDRLLHYLPSTRGVSEWKGSPRGAVSGDTGHVLLKGGKRSHVGGPLERKDERGNLGRRSAAWVTQKIEDMPGGTMDLFSAGRIPHHLGETSRKKFELPDGKKLCAETTTGGI